MEKLGCAVLIPQIINNDNNNISKKKTMHFKGTENINRNILNKNVRFT